MSTKCCEDFIVGMCPYEEFYVENVTVNCPYAHIGAERESYKKSKSRHDFEPRVLSRYKEIIREVDNKTAVNLQLLAREPLPKGMQEALNECSHLIESTNASEFNFEKTHTLLVLHGRLLESIREGDKAAVYDVCRNCSAFKERRGACSHEFCQKYKKLRDITTSLEKKLSRLE